MSNSTANPSAAAAVSVPAASDLLAAARRHSRYVARLLEAEPRLAAEVDLTRPFSRAAMQTYLACDAEKDRGALYTRLRALRKRVMLCLITRDVGGLADLAEVVATTTALAEETIACAANHASRTLAERHGAPTTEETTAPVDLMVVGMGKLGGSELNASSDVDLVFVYTEEGNTNGPVSISNHEYFTRVGRAIIAALNDSTADGYVFRVDMRLRPYGDSGPLVVSLPALENYFIAQGREWERYAWIKARVVCGRGAEALDAIVRPFVYRRHLDFNAFGSMRDLHSQIRQEVRRRDLGNNIKLGPGGIREIEFLAQVFQLIRGGQVAALRIRPTLAVLHALAERHLLTTESVHELEAAYVFLRNLEHRLQYLDDRQTQTLPAHDVDCALIAESMGYAGYGEFLEALHRHRQRVTRHFEDIFAGHEPQPGSAPCAAVWRGTIADEDAVALLARQGFVDAPAILHRLRELRRGLRYKSLSSAGQGRVDRLLPQLVDEATRHPGPDATLERMLKLLESIATRSAYLSLLLEYPQAIERLAQLCSASPWAADYLALYPVLLDELLDPRILYATPGRDELAAALRARLDELAGDTERQMEALRHFKHTQTIHLAAQDLAGDLPLESLSDHLSDLACVILAEVLRLAWEGLKTRHRAEPRFAIIGYGKLGGKELGYATDLDIIFLYDDAAAEAPVQYARLAQRISGWLTTITPGGILYETDLRLRPDGASGLLVSPFEAFAEYQRHKAWPWEHQALTRARFAAGDRALGARFEELRVEMLRTPRDLVVLREKVAAMRTQMLEGHPNRSKLFDLKHDRGGLVDVEFIVQFLVPGHACRHAELTGNIGNLALLKLAAQLGLIPEPLALGAFDAYREFRGLQHMLRLQGEKYARVPRERVAVHIEAVLALWDCVFGAAATPDGGRAA
ncbi:MAG: bifunctional [glutamate--ammonia ligase]-adenylyl-L-tyrosine phosphorylase/[glutamate--ammonia-ligase] adenylyltransferase [Betaproteobacteria bacterium]|nr:bifunctional [glutamate--ammonia ligase]-adenylyl-L-tyrosine phosphorylase/[glutamate--ammonia-ligase] adenylyltransferase [Betaproteobacteria bacterium]